MNIELAAQKVGRSRRQLYYWMASGKLPYTSQNGSRQVAIQDVRNLTRKGGTQHMADEENGAEQTQDEIDAAKKKDETAADGEGGEKKPAPDGD